MCIRDRPNDNGIILQDSYFALRSYALMKQKYPDTLAKEVYKLLQLFPKPELTFYLTAVSYTHLIDLVMNFLNND